MRLADRHAAWGTMLFAMALAACAAPISSSPGPTATSPSSASPEATATSQSSASLEPAARVPLVFRLDRFDAAAWVPHLTLYEDGRLVRLDRPTDNLTVQTMSNSGMEALLSEVNATGSFTISHNVSLEPLPGVEVPGIDPPLDRFTLAATGAEPVIVINTPYHDPLFFKSSAERETLMALADRVMDTSWLPAEAWVDASSAPFSAEAYLVFSGVYATPGICPMGSVSDICKRDVATIDMPIDLPLDGIGTPFKSADGTESVVDHCAVIDPGVANALAAALWPEFGSAAGHLQLDASIPWRAQGATFDVTIRPLYPEEEATCAGKSLPPTIGP